MQQDSLYSYTILNLFSVWYSIIIITKSSCPTTWNAPSDTNNHYAYFSNLSLCLPASVVTLLWQDTTASTSHLQNSKRLPSLLVHTQFTIQTGTQFCFMYIVQHIKKYTKQHKSITRGSKFSLFLLVLKKNYYEH